MPSKMLIKRGNRANLPILDSGEMALCSDTGETFVGTPSGNIGFVTSASLNDQINDQVGFINAKLPPAPLVACVGDGVTDDTSAINAMLAALPIGGGTVYFPNGTYRINNTVNLPRQSACKLVRIIGSGSRSNCEFAYYGSGAAFNAVGITSDRVAFLMRDFSVKCYAVPVAQVGINLGYNQYSAMENVKVTSFFDGIVSGDNWGISFRDVTCSSNASYGFRSIGITNNLSFFGGTFTANTIANMYLTGLNHRIIGVDVSAGGTYCLHMNNCRGCNIEVYMETPGTGAGIYINGGHGMVINGLCVSAWGENTTLLKCNGVNGITVNGFSAYISGSSTAILGTYGMHFTSCHSITINSANLQNLGTGIYINDTYGLISKPDFTNCTVNIEFNNHSYTRVVVIMGHNHYAACTVPAAAAPYIRWIFQDLITYGPTASRPTVVPALVRYFDSTLHKDIVWDGAAWRDGTGAIV